MPRIARAEERVDFFLIEDFWCLFNESRNRPLDVNAVFFQESFEAGHPVVRRAVRLRRRVINLLLPVSPQVVCGNILYAGDFPLCTKKKVLEYKLHPLLRLFGFANVVGFQPAHDDLPELGLLFNRLFWCFSEPQGRVDHILRSLPSFDPFAILAEVVRALRVMRQPCNNQLRENDQRTETASMGQT